MVGRARAQRIILGLLAVSLGWWLYRDTDVYLAVFGLRGDNTLYDYHTSRFPIAVYWTMHMCSDGECLTHREWACGFENGPDSAVDECFSELSQSAPVWWSLDRVRKACGHRYMIHTGQFGDPKRCQELGGPPHPASP